MTEPVRPPEPPAPPEQPTPPEPSTASTDALAPPAAADVTMSAEVAPPAAPPPAPPPAPVAPAPVPPPAPPPVAPAPHAPTPAPPAVAAAEQAAREAASQVADRTRAWWGRLDPTGKRPTLIVAGVLAALVIGTQVVNGIIPVPSGSGGPGPGNGGPTVGARPVDVGMGVRIYALSGWQQLEVTGPLAGVRLQSGSVVLDVRVTQFGGDHVALLTAYVNQVLQPDSQNLNMGQVTVVPINGRTAARAGYLGLFNGVTGSVEGELTTFVFPNGVGVIVDAWGAQGSLERALAEIHAMVDTIEVR